MKTTIAVLLSIIAVMAYFMVTMFVTIETVMRNIEKEQRYSHEVIKACDGHRYYLMNILDEHHLEYFK
jgi:uncharacterized protein YneF (UPF0154 family)